MSHSREPWRAVGSAIYAAGVSLDSGERESMIAEFSVCAQNVQPPEHEANIERIIACVNACKKIPTEQLDGAVTFLLHMAAHKIRELRTEVGLSMPGEIESSPGKEMEDVEE